MLYLLMIPFVFFYVFIYIVFKDVYTACRQIEYMDKRLYDYVLRDEDPNEYAKLPNLEKLLSDHKTVDNIYKEGVSSIKRDYSKLFEEET